MIIALTMNAWLSADTSYSTPFSRKVSFSGSNQYVSSEFHVSITVSIIVRKGRPTDMSLLNKVQSQ